jgi:hypothetical protein
MHGQSISAFAEIDIVSNSRSAKAELAAVALRGSLRSHLRVTEMARAHHSGLKFIATPLMQ